MVAGCFSWYPWNRGLSTITNPKASKVCSTLKIDSTVCDAPRILYTQLRVTAGSYNSLDTLINELETFKKQRVLLLDKPEAP